MTCLMQHVIRQFSSVSPNPYDVNALYYNPLDTFFPPDTDFFVDPKFLPDLWDLGNLIVLLENKPFLVQASKSSQVNFKPTCSRL